MQRHREPTNLNKESFLKQFEGKTADDPITVGKDIDPIDGYDKSIRGGGVLGEEDLSSIARCAGN